MRHGRKGSTSKLESGPRGEGGRPKKGVVFPVRVKNSTKLLKTPGGVKKGNSGPDKQTTSHGKRKKVQKHLNAWSALG